MCFQELTNVVHFKENGSAAKMIVEISHTNISSAKMKFSRNEKIDLWILHNNDNLCCTCNIIGVRVLRILSFPVLFSHFLKTFLIS